MISGKDKCKNSYMLELVLASRIANLKLQTFKNTEFPSRHVKRVCRHAVKSRFIDQDADRCAAEQVSVETVPGKDERESNQGLEPVPDVFALGDCCANVEAPLPALAQARHARQRSRRLCDRHTGTDMLNLEALAPGAGGQLGSSGAAQVVGRAGPCVLTTRATWAGT